MLRGSQMPMNSSIRSPFDLFAHKIEHTTIHALPDIIHARRRTSKVAWSILFLFAIIACATQIGILLRDQQTSPTTTSIDYMYEPVLQFPTLAICPDVERLINTRVTIPALESGEVTMDYINAVEWGTGIVRFKDWDWIKTRNNTALKIAYDKAIAEHGTIQAARWDIQKKYGLACEDFFSNCKDGFSRPFNCCDVFELTFNMFGACYSTKPNALQVLQSGNLASIRIWVWLWPRLVVNTTWNETLDKQVTTVGYNNDHSYVVGINSGLDQTPQWVDPQYLTRRESIFYRIRKRQRELLVGGKTPCDPKPTVKYFYNYTQNNCGWEKLFFDKLNQTCQFPLLNLLDKHTQVTQPCGLGYMERLYGFGPNNSNDEFCDMWCVFAKLQTPDNSSNVEMTNLCPTPCSYTEYLYSTTKLKDPLQDYFTFYIQLQYDSSNTEVVKEVPRLTVNDYIGVVGGIFGLWLGASLISLVHLAVILIGASVEVCRKRFVRRDNSTSLVTQGVGLRQPVRQVSSVPCFVAM